MSIDDVESRILFSDECLAVVYKRIGEVSESQEMNSGSSVIDVFRPLLEKKVGRPLPHLEAVHRIDQPVSGCLLLALDQASLADLGAQFKEGIVRKRYWAITERGSASRLESGAVGRMEHLLKFDTRTRKTYVQPLGGPGGIDWKRASLSWTCVGTGDRYDFLQIELETGRTHQIRAQFAAEGMIIKGDLKYGAKRSEKGGGIRLHAASIQFRHPLTGDTMTVSSPVMDPDPLWQAFMKEVG